MLKVASGRGTGNPPPPPVIPSSFSLLASILCNCVTYNTEQDGPLVWSRKLQFLCPYFLICEDEGMVEHDVWQLLHSEALQICHFWDGMAWFECFKYYISLYTVERLILISTRFISQLSWIRPLIWRTLFYSPNYLSYFPGFMKNKTFLITSIELSCVVKNTVYYYSFLFCLLKYQ